MAKKYGTRPKLPFLRRIRTLWNTETENLDEQLDREHNFEHDESVLKGKSKVYGEARIPKGTAKVYGEAWVPPCKTQIIYNEDGDDAMIQLRPIES